MSETLLTARAVADLLGFTTATVIAWAEAGTIPSTRLGGRLRFQVSEVEAWLEQQRKSSLLTRLS